MWNLVKYLFFEQKIDYIILAIITFFMLVFILLLFLKEIFQVFWI